MQDRWAAPQTTVANRIYRRKSPLDDEWDEIITVGHFSGEVAIQSHRFFSETISVPPEVLDQQFDLVGFVQQEDDPAESAEDEISALKERLDQSVMSNA